MRVFLDTNVILDALARREPFQADAARVWSLADSGGITGIVSALSFTTLYYIVRKVGSAAKALDMLRVLRGALTIAPCDADVIGRAIDAGFKDFEDAVQYFSALGSGAERLVTRNVPDFPRSGVEVMTPAAFLAAYGA